MAVTTVILLLIFITTSLSASSAAASVAGEYYYGAFTPSTPSSPNPSLIATILSSLGFQDLSSAANISVAFPVTIFAPTDSSLTTCPSCSIPLLLREHSVPGLYPLHFLRTLAFGTKIETLAPNRCLTVTAAAGGDIATKKMFINGVEITKPDLFNDGVLILHSVKGFVSHLSPFSCAVQSMTTLSFPEPPPYTPAFLISRQMLRDAMTRLRVSGYGIVSLAIRVNYPDLSELKSMTLFAMDDESIFADGGSGHTYVAELGFHVVPNRLLVKVDLLSLPRGSTLPTLERGKNLVVTSGDNAPMRPMRINYVKVKKFDMVHNNRIVIHGISMPFRYVDHPIDLMGTSRFKVSSMVDS